MVKPYSVVEEMTCNVCGETWINTGDPACPFCQSTDVEPVPDDASENQKSEDD